jgi:hypothetical protein
MLLEESKHAAQESYWGVQTLEDEVAYNIYAEPRWDELAHLRIYISLMHTWTDISLFSVIYKSAWTQIVCHTLHAFQDLTTSPPFQQGCLFRASTDVPTQLEKQYHNSYWNHSCIQYCSIGLYIFSSSTRNSGNETGDSGKPLTFHKAGSTGNAFAARSILKNSIVNEIPYSIHL